MTDYLMRSLLFVPGSSSELMRSAARRNADVLLLDCEDSVQPNSNKELARQNIVEFAQEFGDEKVLFPRINDRESGELLKDLSMLMVPGIDGFMYPKSKTPEDVYFIDMLIESLEYEKGIKRGSFKLIILIETTEAVLRIDEICKISDRVIAVAYGNEDFLTDLGGINDYNFRSLFTPRTLIAMAAKAHGLVPIDTVHIKVHDLDDLERNLELSRNLGFEGMLALHPKELDIIHRYYTPSLEDYKQAQEIVDLYEASQKEGVGVAILNGKFIGPPLAAKAQAILDKFKKVLKNEKRISK